MFKKLLNFILLAGLLFGVTKQAYAQESTNAYLFHGEGCPHCANEKEFLETVLPQYPEISLQQFEIFSNQKNALLMQAVADKLEIDVGGVPFLVIGDQHFVGFAKGTTDKEIEAAFQSCTMTPCPDLVGDLISTKQQPVNDEINSPTSDTQPNQNINAELASKTINLPLIGSRSISSFSLPVLTFVLALLDGFNPCAMWTLLFLISMLLGMKDRKRMWILGVAFIITSALVYFAFLSAWLNLFLFLGYLRWIRSIIGILAIGAGAYYLRDFQINTKGGCKVMGNSNRQQVFNRIKQIVQKKQLAVALIGIIILAISVNLVELVCSAGLPAIFTQVLSLSNLSTGQYYLYLLFYILIFMADDLFVFITAMITLEAVGIQSKYARYSHLIGGVLMAIIGLLLLFKPGWLMFG